MEKKREVKRSSEKTFNGSAPSEFFSKGYYLDAHGSNYGRKDITTGKPLFSPYTEEFYLGRSRLVVASLLKSIQGVRNAIVLGCARGYMVQAFHERNIDAVGVDISEWAIENGAELVADNLYCGDVCDLSMWGDEEFDLVIALDVLEHIRIPDLYKALDETCRVGKVIVFDAPIDIDDTQPDKSGGADKSHVSIYSKEWWITEFMKRGYEPIHVQEFTYPEEKFDVRWPDNHEHGVTIYLRRTRLPPTATTVPTITVKPGGKDFRILWWSNSPWVGTGYGVGTKHVVYPLNKHYDVRCLSYYGQQWSALNYNGLVCHGNLYDKYGIDAAQLICNNRRWNPHIMITLFDIWIGDSPLPGFRDWFTKIHPYWVPYFPVDASPIPPPTLNQARQAFQCVAMSQYGRRQLEMEGIDAKYIPHGCLDYNTEIITESGKRKLGEVVESRKDKYVLTIIDNKLGFTDIEEYYRVPVSDGKIVIIDINNKKLIGTQDHPILITKDKKTPYWESLGNLSKGMSVCCVDTEGYINELELYSGNDRRRRNDFGSENKQEKPGASLSTIHNDNKFQRSINERTSPKTSLRSSFDSYGGLCENKVNEGIYKGIQNKIPSRKNSALSNSEEKTSGKTNRIYKKQRKQENRRTIRSTNRRGRADPSRKRSINEQKIENVTVQDLGTNTRWVYDIKTKTHDFIANDIIVHNCDTGVYQPTKDRVVDHGNLLDISQPLLPGKEQPWPEGCFVIGKVGANKDVPPRKGYDRDFKALEIFFDQNPDARKDTRMYIHSMANFPGGFPLAHLADINNVAPYMRVTEPFLVYCGLMPGDMSRMYGGFDVLLNASRSEGFGMPIIEAAACGVPTIATDFTSMTELVKGHGWLVNSLKNAGGFETFDTTILMSDWAIPDEFQIAEALEEAYNSPDKVRDLGEKSREFSLNYDWDDVITPLWVELIEDLRERMRVKPREERRVY